MSAPDPIRVALETQLAPITGPDYVWENTPYVPTFGTPYVEVTLLNATPQNIEIGPGYFQPGILQANGFWPKDTGSAAITAWAKQVQAAFPYGATLTSGGVTVHIINTTEIGPSVVTDDRFMVPVKIRWNARIGS